MDVGRLEGSTVLAGLRSGVGKTALGEGLLANVVGKSVYVIGYVCGAGAVGTSAHEAECRLEKRSS